MSKTVKFEIEVIIDDDARYLTIDSDSEIAQHLKPPKRISLSSGEFVYESSFFSSVRAIPKRIKI